MSRKISLPILAAILALILLVGGFVFLNLSQSTAIAETYVDETVTEDGWGTVPYISNDTAVRGEYTPYTPAEETTFSGGTAIVGNDEEELQQERIAGGAVGEAHSTLEELHGITDYSEGEYVPVYGID